MSILDLVDTQTNVYKIEGYGTMTLLQLNNLVKILFQLFCFIIQFNLKLRFKLLKGKTKSILNIAQTS